MYQIGDKFVVIYDFTTRFGHNFCKGVEFEIIDIDPSHANEYKVCCLGATVIMAGINIAGCCTKINSTPVPPTTGQQPGMKYCIGDRFKVLSDFTSIFGIRFLTNDDIVIHQCSPNLTYIVLISGHYHTVTECDLDDHCHLITLGLNALAGTPGSQTLPSGVTSGAAISFIQGVAASVGWFPEELTYDKNTAISLMQKCECGSHAIGFDFHSDYCPLYKKDTV